jgi:hypothetical protein
MTNASSTRQLLFDVEVCCSDGRIGKLQGLILDEKPLTISHLLVRLDGLFGIELHVPAEKAIRFSEKCVELSCRRADLPDLEMVEESEHGDESATALEFLGDDRLSMYVVSAGSHVSAANRWEDGRDGSVVRKSTHVRVQDGPVGKLAGVLVDGSDRSICGVLTVSGRWPKRRVVAISEAEIVGIEDNVVSLDVDNKAVSVMPVWCAQRQSYQHRPNNSARLSCTVPNSGSEIDHKSGLSNGTVFDSPGLKFKSQQLFLSQNERR